MPIEFQLKRKKTNIGYVINPMIEANIKTIYGYIPFKFMLDSGADCSKLPISLSEIIGINLKKCKKESFYGISGKKISVYLSKIDIQIDKFKFPIRCIFTNDDHTPLILGRMDFFNRFNIMFDNKNKKIKLTKIKK